MRTQILSIGLFVLVLVAAPVSFAAMDGLVGAWLFDEGSGDTAADASGNGFDGMLMGNAGWEAQGKYGSALTTDGSEAYVEIEDSEAFEFDDDFTIACWVWNETPAGDHSSFVTKGYHRPGGEGGDSRPWYLLYYQTSGIVEMFLRDEGGANSRAPSTTPVNDGEWHHVVAMKVGDEVKTYIDGQEEASVPLAAKAVYGANDQPLVFMVHFNRWFAGMLDDVAIFNRALSDNEIESIMGGLTGALAVEPIGKLATAWGALRAE